MLYTMMTLLAAQAAIVPAHCTGSGPEVLVRITGFRSRAGQVRVRLFGGPPSSYFDKRQATVRIEVPVPKSGPVSLCVAAPRPGLYAVDVRHDVNGGGTDRSDGGGISGNPPVGLMDVILKRKPNPSVVQVRVGQGTTVVPITLKYLSGGSFSAVGE